MNSEWPPANLFSGFAPKRLTDSGNTYPQFDNQGRPTTMIRAAPAGNSHALGPSQNVPARRLARDISCSSYSIAIQHRGEPASAVTQRAGARARCCGRRTPDSPGPSVEKRASPRDHAIGVNYRDRRGPGLQPGCFFPDGAAAPNTPSERGACVRGRMKKRRRGSRPRKGAPPYPSGRLIGSSKQDRGTPQLRAKRQQLVGDAEDRRASSLLGIFAARRLIQPEEYAAAERYRELHLYAARLATGFVLSRWSADAVFRSEIALKRGFPRTITGSLNARVAFEKARRYVVSHSGARAAAILDDAALFDRLPTASSSGDLWNLRSGLRFS